MTILTFVPGRGSFRRDGVDNHTSSNLKAAPRADDIATADFDRQAMVLGDAVLDEEVVVDKAAGELGGDLP